MKLPHYCKETAAFAIRFFWIVHAPKNLYCFASDRRIHLNDSVGNWIAEPPADETIIAEGKC